MDLTAFYSQFRDETAENIRVVNEGLVELEALSPHDANYRELVDAIFRAMHTIKGSARLLGFEDIGKIAHTCEHILGAVREGRRSMDRALTDDLLRGSDAIVELIAASTDNRKPNIDVEWLTLSLGRGLAKEGQAEEPPAVTPPHQEKPAPSQEEPPQQGAAVLPTPAVFTPRQAPVAKPGRSNARQTIRVRVDRLDKLLNLAGELAVSQQTQEAHLEVLAEIGALVIQQERQLLALEAELQHIRFSPSQREVLDRCVNGALNIGERAGKLIRAQLEQFGTYTNQMGQLVEDLEMEVMAVRLLPIGTIFSNLPRAVRELANETGKEVSLTLIGETTELDRKVIEALNDPLIHLIRNAVDHGIEQPDIREQHGKPRQGEIQVSAQTFGAYVHVVIRDDGRGIDPQQLRQIAVRKGLLTQESAALLTNQEAIELIFAPGFSTAQIITDISGRGVGMDVVRTNILELGGQVHVESQPGSGTTMTLVLPLTLVTTRVLLIEIGEHLFAIPASSCTGSVWTYPEEIRTVEGRAMLPYEGHLVPLLRMADLLDVTSNMAFMSRRRSPALIIGTARRPLAVLVDRLIDEREVVIKPLGPLMERQRRFNGAIQLGDGRLILLINPATLVETARGMALTTSSTKSNAPQRRSRLLVTDDSFATRELIRSILQSAGYDVTTAVDGLDALDKLRNGTFDLVVSDVEMPRIDGFTLTSQIRKDLGLTLPVVIVTSLASEAHKRRGLEAGAQAYIVKGQFDQNNLLGTIRQLLGH